MSEREDLLEFRTSSVSISGSAISRMTPNTFAIIGLYLSDTNSHISYLRLRRQ